MKILSIETSCDETAISILEAKGTIQSPVFEVCGNMTLSQIEAHKQWGGVVPNIAKREHAKNLLPILEHVLKDTNMLIKNEGKKHLDDNLKKEVSAILEREIGLADTLIEFVQAHEVPEFDLITVTKGPGLEPALWVGINFAKAISKFWGIPVLGVNHMEGHTLSVLLDKENGVYKSRTITYPALALLISGGHTELVLIEKPLSYKVIGRTRDDAVGEAFDKVARILGLPYPGGPEISKLSGLISEQDEIELPRPMLHSDDYDFSFSGLKTSVLYKVNKINKITDSTKTNIAFEFEQAVTEVLLKKTLKAATEYNVNTIIIGGGVSANKTIRESFKEKLIKEESNIELLLPEKHLSTDNAIMIGIAGYLEYLKNPNSNIEEKLEAKGNLSL